jgi:hypothetical protein
MSNIIRFSIGGLGGLLPVLASLVAVDLASFASIIDNHGITEGLVIGYVVRTVGLFALGGIMATLNSEVKTPLALVQIGIAAPALVTSYLTGAAAVSKSTTTGYMEGIFISQAYASDKQIQIAGGFLSDVLRGITPGLGRLQIGPSISHPSPVIPGPIKPSVPNLDKDITPASFRVTSLRTNLCIDVPVKYVNYDTIVKSFPPPDYTIESGHCP